MIKNYFKIAWRTLLRNRTYAAINVAGLTLGIAAAILIFTILSYQLSFDTFHPNKDRIYRIVTEFHDQRTDYSPAVPQPLGKAFRNDYTFADQTARVVSYRNMLITLPEEKEVKKFIEDKGVAFAEPAYFDIFDFPLLEGDKRTALLRPNSALITRSIAQKYFGDASPIGKRIRLDNRIDFTITGILKDLPANTDRSQQIYLSYDNLKQQNSWFASDSSWGNVYTGSMCFVRLKPSVTAAQVNKAFPGFVAKYFKGDDLRVWQFRLQPLTEIHFDTRYDGYFDKKYHMALFFIGVFLIVIACVNFINMATAQALSRAREVGVRKVLGSLRNQLFWQFITETALITLLAGVLALGLAFLALPELNQLTMSQMSIRLFSGWQLPTFLTLILAVIIFLSGAYPGLVLARFQPVLALKSKLSQAHVGGFSLRRILVTSQFAIAQLLVIGMIIIGYQMHYSMTADMGFDKESIVTLPLPVNDLTKMHSLRDRLSALSGVEKISLSMQPPASRRNNNTDVHFENRPESERWSVNLKPADDQYISTFGLKLAAGRNLYPADTIREYLVNETFARKIGISPQNIIGKMITIDDTKAPIVGVVNDFHNYSLHSDIEAVAVMPNYYRYQSCSMRIDPRHIREVLASAEKIWNSTYPDYLYSYTFLDERIADFYFLDNILLTLIEVFAGIAIFISCLGLYGLVSFMAVRKTKEIGVRKVLGAGISQILWLFGKEFTRLIVIAFLIAAPVGWWVTHSYLQSFQYRVHVGPVMFLAAISFTFVIAALTVGYRSIRAALANPVKSLRTE
ncbi:MAG TPA: ABC transporter permease [Puia sp.]|nr:ABC transporter permease [Puia sp.]